MRGLSRGLLERPGMSSKVAHWARAIPAAASVAVITRRDGKREGCRVCMCALLGWERACAHGSLGASSAPSPSAAAAGALHLSSAPTAGVARHPLLRAQGGRKARQDWADEGAA